MAPEEMEAAEKKRSPQAWKLRLPWEQQKQAEIQRSAFLQSQENARASTSSMSTFARAFMISRRRLRLDPDKKLHFLYEPGKQVSSAIKIKNVSRSHVAFKFQTTAPKSCFMRPPSGVLAPNENIIATVVKFLEPPERPTDKRPKDKFKIVSLNVQAGVEYTPELFEDQKELVTVERILEVVFIDPQKASPLFSHPSWKSLFLDSLRTMKVKRPVCWKPRPAVKYAELERLQKRLAEADTAEAARKKPAPELIPMGTMVVDGLVIDEWKQRRGDYLARQQGEGGESL